MDRERMDDDESYWWPADEDDEPAPEPPADRMEFPGHPE